MASEPDRDVGVEEGDWILIASHGWRDPALGVGLVARGPGDSSLAVLLYVFGPFAERPPETTLATLRPDDNLMVCLMHTRPITEGRLPIIWHDAGFSRDRWSVPWFSVNSDLPGAHIDAVRTSDDDPFDVVEIRPVSLQDAQALPEYATTSYGAILEKLEHPDLPLPRLSDRF